MTAVTLGIFKGLSNQRTLNSVKSFLKTAAKISNGTNTASISKRTTTAKVNPLNEKVNALIKSYPSSVPWEEVTKVIAEEDKDVKKVILESCLEFKNADAMMSFCKYIMDRGETLSEINLFTIVKAMSKSPAEEILEYEEILIHLFEEFKEFMMASEYFRKFALHVFMHIPYCYKQLLPEAKTNSDYFGSKLVNLAFNTDDVPRAWELFETSSFSRCNGLLEAFTNFCIRQALKNKFSIDLIHSFVNLCKKKTIIIHSHNVMCALLPLVNVLNHCQDDYIWSIKKCTINPQMLCLNCCTTLKNYEMSTDEFEKLKSHVYETLIFNKDVFLKSSHSELYKFKCFLNTCKPYDMVIDGLNFVYRQAASHRQNYGRHLLIDYVNRKKKKVLIISRKHSQRVNYYEGFVGAQCFYTENTSDDDVFLLYAALHAGLGTSIITSDFLITHSAKLHPDIKPLFIRWQLYHQLILDPAFGIILPNRHVGLSQCTNSPEAGGDSYIWHLSYQEKVNTMYNFRLAFNWVCLQAVPKKRVKQNGE